MEALSSLESTLQIVLGAAALGVASWSAWRSLGTPASPAGTAPKTGEIAWSVVAVAMLAGVAVAAGLGGARGI